MAGTLTLEELKKAVAGGEIDTVLVCMVDMVGRLVGKRFQAEFFVDGGHDETHGCDYLLANDIDMEPVPGYAAANWGKGYGDFVLEARPRRPCPDSLAGGHRAGALRRARPPPRGRAASPRAILKRQIARLEAMGCAPSSPRSWSSTSSTRPTRAPTKHYSDLQDRRLLHRGLPHPPDDQGGGVMRAIRKGLQGAGIPVENSKGEWGPGPGGDQRPLRRRAGHGRPPRDPEERHQGDRPPAGQGRHLHGQVALRAGRQLVPHPRLALGQGRQEALFHDPKAELGMSQADAPASWPGSSSTPATSPASWRPTSTPTSASRPAPSRRPRRSGAATTAPPASASAPREQQVDPRRVPGRRRRPQPLSCLRGAAGGGPGRHRGEARAARRPTAATPTIGKRLREMPKTLREATELLKKSKMLRAALRRRGRRPLRPHRRVGAARVRPPGHRLGAAARLRAVLTAVPATLCDGLMLRQAQHEGGLSPLPRAAPGYAPCRRASSAAFLRKYDWHDR